MTPEEIIEAEKRRWSILLASSNPVVHMDQTTKQPVVWVCPNPECRESSQPYYTFVSDYAECPKCGLGIPAITKLVLIHLLVKDRKGPIVGERGFRFFMACDPSREYLATRTNGEAATGDWTNVNCPGCMKSAAYQQKIRSGQYMSVVKG